MYVCVTGVLVECVCVHLIKRNKLSVIFSLCCTCIVCDCVVCLVNAVCCVCVVSVVCVLCVCCVCVVCVAYDINIIISLRFYKKNSRSFSESKCDIHLFHFLLKINLFKLIFFSLSVR